MDAKRRNCLRWMGAVPLVVGGLARAHEPLKAEILIRISVPGPQSLTFLPIELIPPMGFDRATRSRLVIRFQKSGLHALDDVLSGNSDFAALGLSALIALRKKQKLGVAIAAISGPTSTCALILRKSLGNAIRTIQDLRGRTIGATSGNVDSKTYLYMVAQVGLAAHGLSEDQVKWANVGQDYESIKTALTTGPADAAICEEPFVSRLVNSGVAIKLADLNSNKGQTVIPGIHHLRSVVATSPRLIQEEPVKVETMVHMLRHSLQVIHTKNAAMISEKVLQRSDEERKEMARILRTVEDIFSRDGRFPMEAVRETDVFLAAANPGIKMPPAVDAIDTRWAGIAQEITGKAAK